MYNYFNNTISIILPVTSLSTAINKQTLNGFWKLTQKIIE